MVEIDKDFQLVHIIEKIEKEEPFAFSRFGDGEWNAVLNLRGPHQANINGEQHYKDDLRAALRTVLLDKPDYILGMQGLANRILGDNINKFLSENKLKFNWVNSDIFHHASIKRYFVSFMDTLQGREVILIGPSYLYALWPKYIKYHFVVQDKDCWDSYDQILTELMQVKAKVFLFCCGPTANVLIHYLWMNNKKQTYIDTGSVFDPYVGKMTRSYHKDLKL